MGVFTLMAGLLLIAATSPLWPPGLAAAAAEAGRPHLFVASLGLLAGLVFLRSGRRARTALVMGTLALVLHAAALRPVPAAAPANPNAPDAWRVMHANLGRSPDLDALGRWLAEQPTRDRPDAFSLQELRPGQAARIDAALPGYAAAWSLPRTDSRGGGLWLRAGVSAEAVRVRGVPSNASASIADRWLPPEDPAARPLAEFRLDSAGRPPLGLVLFSAARPSNAGRFETRNAEVARLAAVDNGPSADAAMRVWLGDFNAPPWSPALRAAADAGSMRLARGTRPTWPDGPLRRLGVPVDLVLVDAGSSAGVTLGPAIGRDHRPVVAVLDRGDANERRPP